jgi:hypothetical protein
MHAGVSENEDVLVAVALPVPATPGSRKSGSSGGTESTGSESGAQSSHQESIHVQKIARAPEHAIHLSGVMDAIERVYDRRKALSLTQMETKSVVRQARRIILRAICFSCRERGNIRDVQRSFPCFGGAGVSGGRGW